VRPSSASLLLSCRIGLLACPGERRSPRDRPSVRHSIYRAAHVNKRCFRLLSLWPRLFDPTVYSRCAAPYAHQCRRRHRMEKWSPTKFIPATLLVKRPAARSTETRDGSPCTRSRSRSPACDRRPAAFLSSLNPSYPPIGGSPIRGFASRISKRCPVLPNDFRRQALPGRRQSQSSEWSTVWGPALY